MALTTTPLLPVGSYPAGKYNLGPAVLPLGVSAVTLSVDRTTWNNSAFRITVSLEFSPDGGVTWFPWGSFGTTGEALTNPQTGLPVTESSQSVSFIHRIAGDGYGLANPYTGGVPYAQEPGTIEPGWEPTNPNRRVRGTVITTAAITTSVLMTLDDVPVPLTLPLAPVHQSVSIANITSQSTSSSSVTTLTTASFTVTSNANRAGFLSLTVDVNSISAITGSIGGTSGVAIPSSDSGTTGVLRALALGVTAPPAGSQTATMSWTTVADAILGVVTTSGVDQITPFNNGTFATGTTTTASVSITSTPGDLTIDAVCENAGVVGSPTSPTQTQVWIRKINSTLGAACSRAQGAGTDSHTWNIDPGATQWAQTGVNFVAAASDQSQEDDTDRFFQNDDVSNEDWIHLDYKSVKPTGVSLTDIVIAEVKLSSGNTVTTPSLSITSNPNRAGLLGLGVSNNLISNITGSIGGVAGSAIAGADSGSNVSNRALQFGVKAPPSGTQTATMSWTTNVAAVLGVIVTSNVNQITPFNNGTSAFGSDAGPSSITITSTDGDLTVDTVFNNGTSVPPSSPTQTSLWSDSNPNGAGSRGSGDGTATHKWTLASGTNTWAVAGANFRQFTGVPDQPPEEDYIGRFFSDDLTNEEDWIHLEYEPVDSLPQLTWNDEREFWLGDDDLEDHDAIFRLLEYEPVDSLPALTWNDHREFWLGDDDLSAGDEAIWFDYGNEQVNKYPTPQQPREDEPNQWIKDEDVGDDFVWFDVGANDLLPKYPTPIQPWDHDPEVEPGIIHEDVGDDAALFDTSYEQITQVVIVVQAQPVQEEPVFDEVEDEQPEPAFEQSQADTPPQPEEFEGYELLGDDDLGNELMLEDVGGNEQVVQAPTPPQPEEFEGHELLGDDDLEDDRIWADVGANDQGPRYPTPQQADEFEPEEIAGDDDLGDDSLWFEVGANDLLVYGLPPPFPTPEFDHSILAGDDDVGEDTWWFETGANDLGPQAPVPPQPKEWEGHEHLGDDDLGDDTWQFDTGVNDLITSGLPPSFPIPEFDYSLYTGDDDLGDEAVWFDAGAEVHQQAPTPPQPQDEDACYWLGEAEGNDDTFWFDQGNEQTTQAVFVPLTLPPSEEVLTDEGEDDWADTSYEQAVQAPTPVQPYEFDGSVFFSDDEVGDDFIWFEVGSGEQKGEVFPRQPEEDNPICWAGDDDVQGHDEWWFEAEQVPQATTPSQPYEYDGTLYLGDDDLGDEAEFFILGANDLIWIRRGLRVKVSDSPVFSVTLIDRPTRR